MNTTTSHGEFTREQQQLVTTHIQYATNLAWQMRHCGIDIDDLRQEAYYGLCLAARDFNPDKGVTFQTLAFAYCRAAMHRAMRLYGQDDWHKTHQSIDDSFDLPDAAPNEAFNAGKLAELPQAMDNLTPRERQVVSMLYGLGNSPRSLTQTANDLKLPSSRVSRINTRALRKIGDALLPSHNLD